MRIVFLHMTYGLIERGSEIAIQALVAGLRQKHQVRIFHLDEGSVLPPSAPHNLLEKIFFRLRLNESSRLVRRFTANKLMALKEYKPDIVVAVNGADQVKMVKKSVGQAKVVVFGHAGIGHDDLANLHAGPDLFVALTEEAATWAKENAPATTKVVHIPNPIDLASFKKAKSVKLNLPKPVVMTVGALSAYKNITLVIEAIRQLNVSFLLVGDGEQADLVADALSTLHNDFRWLKSVSHDELPSLYKSADVFCFVPDPQEAFGMVYLEAMAAGLPVVASADAIRRGIVGNKGYYADPHNIEDIVSKLVKAVQKEKVDYSTELSKYKISTVVTSLEKEFHELLR